MKLKKRHILLPILVTFFGYILFSIYEEVKQKTIAEFNNQQMIMAKQAANGIESFFKHYLLELSYLASIDDVVIFNRQGKKLLQSFYRINSDRLKAITLVNARGEIVYTVPYNSDAIGVDISYQNHVQTIIKTHKPVVSDVFRAVQGYDAIAYHVPITKDNVYLGSLAVLIPFNAVTKKYIQNIQIRKSGYAWVISKKGVELYNPLPDRVGKTIFESQANFPALLTLAEKMMQGKSGITQYDDISRDGKKSVTTIKHTAFYPVNLGNTHWSIAVATPESEVLSNMKGFTNNLLIIIVLLSCTLFLYSYFTFRSWTILKEEKKRKKAEKALKESEQKYKQISDNALAGIYIVSDNKIRYCNRRFAEMWGYENEEEMTGVGIQNLFEKTSKRKVENEIEKRIFAEDQTSHYEVKCVKKNSEIFDAEVLGSSVIYKDQRAAQGMVVDITERKLAKNALKKSEEWLSTTLRSIGDAVITTDTNGYVTLLNPIAESLTGWHQQDAIGRPLKEVFQIINEKTREQLENPVEQIIKQNKIIGLADHTTLIAKDGQERPIDDSGSPIRNEAGEIMGVVLVFRDMTERKQTQALMIQTEKMMSIGGLAAGMAHELNNPLGGMLQGIQNIQRRLTLDLKSNYPIAEETGIDLRKLQSYLKKRGIFSSLIGIQESGKKASQIILNMLQFSRKSESKMVPTNLIELFENVLELAGKDYDLKKRYDFRNIDIVKEFDVGLPPVPCTQTEIEQVLLNLLGNAAWAMANQNSNETSRIILRIYAENEMARIEVEDNGPGIDEKIKKRIFEPFYTTKPVGEGTGLGLSVSYMIITNIHDGTIEVESEPGKGTRFIIKLPLIRNNQ